MMAERGLIKMLIGNESEGFSDEDPGFLLREQRRHESINRDLDRERDRELNVCRSGSCPPTVEGSLNAVEGIKNGNGFLTEEDLRSDPAYLSYYYSNVNLNPRLPPPIMSKEDWRFAQRVQGIGSSKVGGIGDNRKIGAGTDSRSMFSMWKNEEKEVEWLNKEGDGLIGLSLGRKKSLADIFQDDLGPSNPILGHPSRPSSCNAFDDSLELQNVSPIVKNYGPSASQTFASVIGSSLSRNNTPDPQLMARAPSPGLPPVGVKLNNADKKNNNGYGSFNTASSDDLLASLSGMSLSNVSPIDEDINTQSKLQKEMEEHQNFLFGMQGAQNNAKQNHFQKNSEPTHSNILSHSHSMKTSYPDLARSSGPNSYSKAASAYLIGSPSASPAHYQNINTASAFTSYGMNGYPIDPASSSMLADQFGKFSLGQNLTEIDPLYAQYLRSSEYLANNTGNSYLANDMGNSYLDMLAVQKQYLESLLLPQKQYGMPFLGKSGGLNNGYYGNPAFGLGMGYPGSPVLSPVLPASPGGPGSPLRLGERSMRFPSGMRSWHSDINESFAASMLDEFKSNKTKSYELSDILGHVVEFSADQYGSRFIQQKLETATTEEKNMVHDEIKAHAFSLMTDVFGNYVIQKFFEHGSATQRRELADQLTGHVLSLSLQMYGCRVIQKAIEVVDLDQQTKMVAELDGHIMRCVRDQNGNHVIQKCIECIPQDAIQFIVSTFYDQVVILSTHPYGCRVIQRVLEHCDDPKTQQIMMDEIMQHVCLLAQNQYGNYVVQHVLEHGKLQERTAVIKKLAGQIVQMSQQKFASNVVEKCLAFGGPAERQFLVNEMLGTTDENEPLQAMMKDQFANYVVQKVLETCDDQQRELILTRIKVHLNALKKYTYGKHIVARVEKLVATGERRIGVPPSYIS